MRVTTLHHPISSVYFSPVFNTFSPVAFPIWKQETTISQPVTVCVCSRSNMIELCFCIVPLMSRTALQEIGETIRYACDFTLVPEMMLVVCTPWVPCSCKVCCAYHHNQQGTFNWYHGTWPHISQGCHEFHINNLVVMGSDQVLVQISRWPATQCDDMSTTCMYEEADIIIVQQVARITDNTFGCCGQHTHIFIVLYFCVHAVENQAVQFMLVCYGKSNSESLTKVPNMMWTIKLVGVKLLHLFLYSLPPTNDSFMQNTLRAHLRIITWLNYLESYPPYLGSTSYGFLRMKDQPHLTRRLWL